MRDSSEEAPTPSVEDTRENTPAPKQWHVSTVAGSAQGTADGRGADAQFNSPVGIAVTSDGTLYVSDYFNHRIRKIDTSGAVTTFAGSDQGHRDAITGTDAQFNFPVGIAASSDGTLYVADSFNDRIRKIALPSGEVTTLAGSGTPGHRDARGISAQFKSPSGIAVSSDGDTLYVVDLANHRIRKIDISSKEVTTIAGSTGGHRDATGNAAQFYNPSGIAASSDGTLYVADTGNHRIRKIEFK